jgi:hypothetical protein
MVQVAVVAQTVRVTAVRQVEVAQVAQESK